MNRPEPIRLRRTPYPYRAMLAICSDLDETPDGRAYMEIARYLNTRESTAMGPGVGLEVGNSIYFDMPGDQFSYWGAGEADRHRIHAMIRSGHIDCLHSFGDHAVSRLHAGKALDELAKHDCRLEVWVDHAVAPSNFGPDIMRGHGDQKEHAAYHADLTVGFGIQYVWRGRITSVLGQCVPPRLRGILTARHPARSVRTAAKETFKRLLARCGSRRYALHRSNRLLHPCRLRDGSNVREFLRSNPHWCGVTGCDTGWRMGELLSDSMLENLSRSKGFCVLYCHLGKIRDRRVPFDAAARAGFERLAKRYHDGEILVTTTRRLLGYRRATEEISFQSRQDGQVTWIDVTTKSANTWGPTMSDADLDGLTFYVPDASRTRLRVDGSEVDSLGRNAPDQTGNASVSLPWRRLEFPNL